MEAGGAQNLERINVESIMESDVPSWCRPACRRAQRPGKHGDVSHMHQRLVRVRQGKAALWLLLDSILHRKFIEHEEAFFEVFIKVLMLTDKLGMFDQYQSLATAWEGRLTVPRNMHKDQPEQRQHHMDLPHEFSTRLGMRKAGSDILQAWCIRP